ncbi:MAG: hypothetical protein GY850_08670 [bacterium]|nr:hypothetical protein [bacterium]
MNSIVTDWDGLLLCVIETTEAEVQAFHMDGGVTWDPPVRVNNDPTNNGAW